MAVEFKWRRVIITDSDGNYIEEDNPLFVNNPLLRKTGNITVSSGSGSIILTDVDIRVTFIGVKGPSTSSEFIFITTDTDSGVDLNECRARNDDLGVARSNSISIPMTDITLNIFNANENGDYTYLIMG